MKSKLASIFLAFSFTVSLSAQQENNAVLSLTPTTGNTTFTIPASGEILSESVEGNNSQYLGVYCHMSNDVPGKVHGLIGQTQYKLKGMKLSLFKAIQIQGRIILQDKGQNNLDKIMDDILNPNSGSKKSFDPKASLDALAQAIYNLGGRLEGEPENYHYIIPLQSTFNNETALICNTSRELANLDELVNALNQVSKRTGIKAEILF